MVIKRMIRVVFFLVLVVGLLTAGCYSRGQILPEFDKTFTNSIGMRFMSIPAGSFEMGNSDPGIQDWDEAPVHGVSISAGFYMSETEVTLEQYRQFRPDFSGSMLEYPAVVGLSWDDAAAFCEWLSDKEGIVYRLPTEAEWEYACRAGTSTPYWSGAEPPEQGVPNPWGLKHMHSGPREWCYDWYGPYPHGAQINPVGPAEGFALAGGR